MWNHLLVFVITEFNKWTWDTPKNIWWLAILTRFHVIHRANKYYVSVFSGNPVLKKTGCYFEHMIGIKITDKHESNTDKMLYCYVLGTVIINLWGYTMVYLTVPHSHTHQHQLLFLSCVSVFHLTWSSFHRVGCSPCCSLVPVHHQLSLEYGHYKQDFPPHHTSSPAGFGSISLVNNKLLVLSLALQHKKLNMTQLTIYFSCKWGINNGAVKNTSMMRKASTTTGAAMVTASVVVVVVVGLKLAGSVVVTTPIMTHYTVSSGSQSIHDFTIRSFFIWKTYIFIAWTLVYN